MLWYYTLYILYTSNGLCYDNNFTHLYVIPHPSQCSVFMWCAYVYTMLQYTYISWDAKYVHADLFPLPHSIRSPLLRQPLSPVPPPQPTAVIQLWSSWQSSWRTWRGRGEQFWYGFCTQLMKAYMAEMSCNQLLLIDWFCYIRICSSRRIMQFSEGTGGPRATCSSMHKVRI